jgi:hypothetical protein
MNPVFRTEKERELIFGPQDKPYGMTYGQWTVRWWQWLLALPKENNPAIDDTGANAAASQDDPNVWFLAGTFPRAGVPHRLCKIPEKKAVLFPTINYEANLLQDRMFDDECKLKEHVKSDVDDIVYNHCVIDGVELPVYRIMSDPILFPISIAERIPYTVGGSDEFQINEKMCFTRAVSDGYWIFLKPLERGQHELHFAGACAAGRRRTEAFYQILVT